jgi:lipopolysaccharide biosynthesis regulator YciM
MRNYLNQQLEKKDEQLETLTNDHGVIKEWQKKVEVAEEMAKGILDELRTHMTKYDELG